jgi:hypothetical protein
MLFAAEAAKTPSAYTNFDIFVLVFTLVIAIGLFRLVKSPKKNLFAIGFAGVSLVVFLLMDYIMVSGW